jgi:hypothetical protein
MHNLLPTTSHPTAANHQPSNRRQPTAIQPPPPQNKTKVAPRDETALMAAVARLGPVAVSIDAAAPGFKYFAGGVFQSDTCSNDDLDHAVLVSPARCVVMV